MFSNCFYFVFHKDLINYAEGKPKIPLDKYNKIVTYSVTYVFHNIQSVVS